MLQTDWIKADTDLVKALVAEKSAAYAKEHKITPRNPAAETDPS